MNMNESVGKSRVGKPLLFSAPMVRALLDGRKRQTRRIYKPQPVTRDDGRFDFHGPGGGIIGADATEVAAWMCDVAPYAVGDLLWVRETCAIVPASAYRNSEGVQQTLDPNDRDMAAIYRACFDRSGKPPWRPSIHMPRWASRLTLAVTEVRVQRLQEISEADAVAEGVSPSKIGEGWWTGGDGQAATSPVSAYALLWNSINGPGAWDANPWVVALTFDVITENIDRISPAKEAA